MKEASGRSRGGGKKGRKQKTKRRNVLSSKGGRRAPPVARPAELVAGEMHREKKALEREKGDEKGGKGGRRDECETGKTKKKLNPLSRSEILVKTGEMLPRRARSNITT